MDNVTHVLAGLLAAEVVVQHRGGRKALPEGWVAWAYGLSAAANNLPDADIVYVGITEGKLGYLLHHRGHTHTVAFALLAALVGHLFVRWLVRRRAWSADDGKWLSALVVVGPLLHLALDGANNYGIHPFWPLFNGWLYGDVMFIVEPLLWASLAVPLAWSVGSRVGQVVLALLVAAGLALSWALRMVPAPSAVFLTLWTAAVAVAAWRFTPRRRAGLAAGATLAVYALLIGFGARARQELDDASRRAHPDETLVEASAVPMPANPWCWDVNTLSVAGDEVVYRRAQLVVARLGDPADLCPPTSDRSTAPFQPVSQQEGSMTWTHEARRPLASLRGLTEDCRASAFLRWSRLPFEATVDGTRVVGDIRYDFSDDLGWAEITLGDQPCPRWVPGWTPPRHELLAFP